MPDISNFEIELKLMLPGADTETLVVDFLRQHGYKMGEAELLKNTDVYMDTSDWALLKNKLSLRYRLANNQAIYTMKSVGTIEDGIARRMETETVLDKPARSPTDIPVQIIKNTVDEIISPRKLLEQVLIRTNRHRRMVNSPGGAELELSFDASNFFSSALDRPRRTAQLYQMEAEIKAGPADALDSLAALLAGKFGFQPATGSKLTSAIEYLKIEPLVKKVPENLKIRLDDRLDVALKKILAVEFDWYRKQLTGAMSDRDPEYVHQARVATRRMRSALILFDGALPEKTAAYLLDRLKWLGSLFGAVRDLDVFIINLTGYEDRLESFPKNKKRSLERLVVKKRRPHLQALNEALKSRRCQYFERRMNEVLKSASDDAVSLPGLKLIREFAPPAVLQRFGSVVDQSRITLASQKLKDFHCLRIQMKRLRYAFEFMASPYGDAFKAIIQRTVEIQDCLGELQDTVFIEKLIRGIKDDWRGKLLDPDLVFILGEIYQLQGEIAGARQKAFIDIWDRFSVERTEALLNQIFQEQTSPPQSVAAVRPVVRRSHSRINNNRRKPDEQIVQ